MNALGIIVLAVIVLGFVAWVRKVRQENAQCCDVKPSTFPVKKDAAPAAPAPKKVAKPRKSTKKVK